MLRRNPSFRLFLAGLAGLLLASVASTSAIAQPVDVNVSAGLTAQGAPLALRGYDPVSYFEPSGPVRGRAEHSAVHAGATYRFASRDNLRRFEADPHRSLPQYGGFCAYGVSVGAKFDGDPLVFKVVEGKLYLNLNTEIQKAWNQDVAGAIRKAEGHWPKIRQIPARDLKPQG